jgi:anti-sigma factor RsiW
VTEPSVHRVLTESLGSYVLGHLSDEEAGEVRTHLTGCPACQAELAEILPAASALSGAPRPLRAPARPPVDLGDRLEARIRSEERRQRSQSTRRAMALSALSAAAAAAIVVAGVAVTRSDSASDIPLEAVDVVETSPVQASADLVDHTWGVEVKLTASGLQPGERYDVTVLGEDGTAFVAGAFVGTDGEVRCNLNAAVLRDRAAAFVVLDQDGAEVMRAEFPT